MTLPTSSFPTLYLTHPTPLEIHLTHHLSSPSWAGPLTKEQYVENELHLASHLLVKQNGITYWILISESGVENERVILASCETIPKRCLVRRGGEVRDEVVVGVAGVFCEPKLRGRGFAGRMMRELALVLEKEGGCVASVLWSDIGPKFYADLGWKPFPSMQVELPASRSSLDSLSIATRPVLADGIEALCVEEEAMLRVSMAGVSTSKTLFAIVPDHHTMLWHHKKEEYICEKLFGRHPDVKGAIVGVVGNRVWAIWTRGLYGAIDDLNAGNKLYILRLVVEDPTFRDSTLQVEQLKLVLQATQNEAMEWKLGRVELWNPDERVRDLIERTGIKNRTVQRANEGIPSLLWFGEREEEGVEWLASEKYAWC